MYISFLLLSIIIYAGCFIAEKKWRYSIFLSALACHGIGSFLTGQALHITSPLTGLSGVSWLIGILLFTQLKRPKIESLLKPSLSIIILMLLIGMLSPKASVMAVSQKMWVVVHLSLILIGYFAFTIGAILGGMYVIVQSRLKQRKLSGIHQYLSLQTLDIYNYRAIIIGFASLLSGVVAGVFWALENKSFHLDITTGTTFVLLGWYAAGLIGRYIGKQARWSAWFSLIGFSSLLVVVFLASIVGAWHFGQMG